MRKYFTDNLIGSRIVDINRTLDLVMFTFELKSKRKVFFHVQCFIRIFDLDRLVICTQDMLRRSTTLKKRQKFDWAKVGGTLYDDTIAEYQDKLFSARVQNFTFNNKDVMILFDNNMRMEVFVHITESDDPKYSENYRIFSEDEDKEHFII